MRHGKNKPSRNIFKTVFLTLLALFMVLAGTIGALWFKAESNIKDVNVDKLLGQSRPTPSVPVEPSDGYAGQPLNILVMGVDIRDEDNASFAGEADGVRSDTTMLVHLYADRKHAEIVSIPRDLIVDIPECMLSDGTMTPARAKQMFNSAFSVGAGNNNDLASAAACTRKTFETNTGVYTHEHVVVKMNGVRNIVDLLGGVKMNIPEAMVSPKAGLNISAGEQTLDGTTAIAYLRARTGEGNGLEAGSDLGRLDRQQQFLDAFLDTLKTSNLLTDPVKLTRLVDQGSSSIEVSDGIGNVTDLAGLAYSLRGLSSENLITSTAPTVPSPSNKNRLVWGQGVEELWARINADQLPPEVIAAAPAPTNTLPAS